MIKELFVELSKMRREKGWSTYDLADKAKIHQTQVVRLELGDTASIKRVDDFLEKISTALGVSLEDMTGGKKCIEHLPPELQTFVIDPANEKAIRRAYLESELRKIDEEPKA